jgi:hypothetical protein
VSCSSVRPRYFRSACPEKMHLRVSVELVTCKRISLLAPLFTQRTPSSAAHLESFTRHLTSRGRVLSHGGDLHERVLHVPEAPCPKVHVYFASRGVSERRATALLPQSRLESLMQQQMSRADPCLHRLLRGLRLFGSQVLDQCLGQGQDQSSRPHQPWQFSSSANTRAAMQSSTLVADATRYMRCSTQRQG